MYWAAYQKVLLYTSGCDSQKVALGQHLNGSIYLRSSIYIDICISCMKHIEFVTVAVSTVRCEVHVCGLRYSIRPHHCHFRWKRIVLLYNHGLCGIYACLGICTWYLQVTKEFIYSIALYKNTGGQCLCISQFSSFFPRSTLCVEHTSF